MRTESGMRNLWKHVFEQHVISRASVQSLTIHFPSLSQIFWFPLHSNFVAPGAWNCRRRKRSTSLWSNRFNCLRNRQERQNHGHLDGAAFCLKMYFAKRRLSVVVKHKMLQICYWVTGVPGYTGIHQFLSWKSKHPTSCCLTYSAAEAQVLHSDTSGTFRCPPEPSLPTSRPRQHMIGKHCLKFLSSVAVREKWKHVLRWRNGNIWQHRKLLTGGSLVLSLHLQNRLYWTHRWVYYGLLRCKRVSFHISMPHPLRTRKAICFFSMAVASNDRCKRRRHWHGALVQTCCGKGWASKKVYTLSMRFLKCVYMQ